MLTPNSPEIAIPNAGAEIAAQAAAQRASLAQSITPTSGMMEATKTIGQVAAPIASTIVNTGLALGSLFFLYKGMKMVVTGKNSFKNETTA